MRDVTWPNGGSRPNGTTNARTFSVRLLDPDFNRCRRVAACPGGADDQKVILNGRPGSPVAGDL
ncbi:hypothetical protein ACFUN7_27665 [Streptomyces sp. NPDC057236]|uniref:hypothetical protein n=1 Tax=Streptomyces sp. NPDC057236 TaxID=3346059 RepID=UPI003644B30F